MSTSGADNDEPTYKVEKVIQRYDLTDMGKKLERRWLGTNGEPQSLRKLADEFNRAVLRKALEGAGQQPLNGDVENTYRILTDDDVSRGTRTKVQRSLERNGVDHEQVEQDFVTHQAIHTYLVKGRGVQKETGETDRKERMRQTIQRLESRVTAVSETAVEQLRNAGILTLGEFNVFVSISVTCTECDTHKSIMALFDDEGCECTS